MLKEDKKRLEERFNWFTAPSKEETKEPEPYPGMGEIIKDLKLEGQYYD